MIHFQVLSPDGIPISPDGAIFSSLSKAKKALKEWTLNYSHQGYYSQLCYNGYRRQIPVNSIADYCDIVPLPDTDSDPIA